MLKKLSEKQKRQNERHRAKLQRRVFKVRNQRIYRVSKARKSPFFTKVWYRGKFYSAKISDRSKVNYFPKVMCFDDNPAQTLESIASIREKLNQNKVSQKRWVTRRINDRTTLKFPGYSSVVNVERMSTSAALVLASEYDRKYVQMDEAAPLFDLESWNPLLVWKLQQIGFFDTFDTRAHVQGYSPDEDVLTIPFTKGERLRMEQADRDLQLLVSHIDPDLTLPQRMTTALLSAVGEATQNVREHAYREDHRYEIPHVGLWWATGAASRRYRRIQISLFDQGVSIPVSYTKLPLASTILEQLSLLLSSVEAVPYANDAKLIKAATEYGNSARKLDEHAEFKGGLGLPQMKDAINFCGAGRLMILSRGGQYTYSLSGGVPNEELSTFTHSIGGTLIEWTIELSEVEDV